MTTKILNGTVQMARTMGGHEEDKMHIRIEDDLSGCLVLEIYMSLEEFAKALTSSLGQAEIKHFPDSPVGKKAESKTETVPFDWTKHRGHPAAVAKALKPFEVDGWKARSSDMGNHHCTTKDGQQVIFFRYVEVAR